jgi:hypothetical protein
LPEDIRAIGWCEVTPEFSSRFSAAYRTYRYFFVRRDLDIDAMNKAAALLVGDHDFRNLCKMDIVKVSNFRREIYSAEILPFMENKEHPEQTVMMLQIRGIAFLWHMVRCIMAVLTMVGEGVEEPDIFTRLFDVDTYPAKPNYMMANELPLVLHECGFDSMTIHHQPQVMWNLMTHYEGLWDRYTVAASRAYNAMQTLKERLVRRCDAEEFLAFMLAKRRELFERKVSGTKRGVQVIATSAAASAASAGEENEKARDYFLSAANDRDLVKWAEVLRMLREDFELVPSAAAQPHVPLLQRNMGDTYEERIAQVKGRNKVKGS